MAQPLEMGTSSRILEAQPQDTYDQPIDQRASYGVLYTPGVDPLPEGNKEPTFFQCCKRWSIKALTLPFTPVYRLGNLPFLFYDPARYRGLYWERLNEFSGGDERGHAAKVLAHYVKDYHLHLFRYPPHLNQDKWHWTATIFRGRNGQYTWYGEKFKNWAEGNEKLFFHAIESTLLKAFGGLSQRIASMATDEENINYDPDYVFKTTLGLLKNTVDHLTRINEARRQYGPAVDKDVLRAEFGVNLHWGLPVDARLNAAGRREWMLDQFFRRISKQLLDVALPSGPDDVEFPFGLRKWTWNQLRESILPNALLDITEEILLPYNLDSLLLTFLEAYNRPSSKRGTVSAPIKVDMKQKSLNKICEELIGEMMTLFGPRLAKVFLKIPKLKEKLGEAVGQALREQVSINWTVDGILNSIVDAWLPTFHAGSWRTIDGKKTFVPLKRIKQPSGEVIDWPAAGFSFTHFAKNEVERRGQQEALDCEREELEKQLLAVLDHTLNRELKRAIPDALEALWVKVRPTIDPWVEGYFGRPGVHVAKSITATIRLLFKLSFMAVALLFFPLTRFVGIIVDQYTKSKAKDIIKCMQMDIHRNLFYNCIDTLVNSLSFNSHNRMPQLPPQVSFSQ